MNLLYPDNQDNKGVLISQKLAELGVKIESGRCWLRIPKDDWKWTLYVDKEMLDMRIAVAQGENYLLAADFPSILFNQENAVKLFGERPGQPENKQLYRDNDNGGINRLQFPAYVYQVHKLLNTLLSGGNFEAELEKMLAPTPKGREEKG